MYRNVCTKKKWKRDKRYIPDRNLSPGDAQDKYMNTCMCHVLCAIVQRFTRVHGAMVTRTSQKHAVCSNMHIRKVAGRLWETKDD